MENKKLHIVCFDVPYPADHGGMFDLFFKIVSLHKMGVEITLHCFEYGKGKQNELKNYCAEIYYYKRRTGIKGISLKLPYIVSSRKSKLLIANLRRDNDPILLEGTHTSYIAYRHIFPERKILYRLHNIEHIYYYNLFRTETNFFKKLYYWIEAAMLKNYERKVLKNVSVVLPVSKKDTDQIRGISLMTKVHYLPVFLPFQRVNILDGQGSYCLYHGNLSIAENVKAVVWLANKMDTDHCSLIIAGRNPSAWLTKFLRTKKIKLIANPSDEELLHLIQHAHINIVLSFNETGIKLKLLNALFHGRYCIANEAAIPDAEFKKFCDIISSEENIMSHISLLTDKPIDVHKIEARKEFLLSNFDNLNNALQLIALL